MTFSLFKQRAVHLPCKTDLRFQITALSFTNLLSWKQVRIVSLLLCCRQHIFILLSGTLLTGTVCPICDSSLGCYLQSKTRPCCCSSETFYNYFKTYRENLLQMLPKKQNGSKRFNQRWILTQDDNFYKPEQEQKRKDTTSLRNRTVEKDKLTQQTAEQDR